MVRNRSWREGLETEQESKIENKNEIILKKEKKNKMEKKRTKYL